MGGMGLVACCGDPVDGDGNGECQPAGICPSDWLEEPRKLGEGRVLPHNGEPRAWLLLISWYFLYCSKLCFRVTKCCRRIEKLFSIKGKYIANNITQM